MSKKLKLTDREWRAFSISSLFDVFTGANISPKKLSIGIVPRISATDNNNGIDSFYTPIQNNSYRTNKECVSVSFLGSVFYQPYEASYDMKIHSLRLKGNKAISEHYGLFVATELRKQCSKFSYGNQVSSTDLPTQKLLLPIQADGTPDWKFMKAYMRQVEDELLSEVRPKLEAQLLEHIISLGALEDREWKEFYFSDVFTRIQRGKRLKKDDHIEGTTPYVSSTATNNGIYGFVGNKERVRIFSNCISLANSGSVGSAFFQKFEFVASDHVTSLQKEGIDEYAYLFMLPIIRRLSEKYSFNREINDLRISRERLMLPVQLDCTPDWEFMSAFMQRVEQETLGKALQFFKLRCEEMQNRGGGKMQSYFIEDVLFIANGVRLTKADIQEGSRPFDGASEASNGVTAFIENSNASLDSNVLGVNYNGSVGFSFYHPYEALLSDDVKCVRWKDETANNKYTLLYLSTAIAQQRRKYAYGYKFNAQRMKRQILMLPSCEDGSPDYAYMEQTMRVMEYDVLKTYLMSK